MKAGERMPQRGNPWDPVVGTLWCTKLSTPQFKPEGHSGQLAVLRPGGSRIVRFVTKTTIFPTYAAGLFYWNPEWTGLASHWPPRPWLLYRPCYQAQPKVLDPWYGQQVQVHCPRHPGGQINRLGQKVFFPVIWRPRHSRKTPGGWVSEPSWGLRTPRVAEPSGCKAVDADL